tara:strand:- start:334 stop:462 length:129 start_codon:yes stop_codon:yes gene_type:complete
VGVKVPMRFVEIIKNGLALFGLVSSFLLIAFFYPEDPGPEWT